jgi:hypothetical protein
MCAILGGTTAAAVTATVIATVIASATATAAKPDQVYIIQYYIDVCVCVYVWPHGGYLNVVCSTPYKNKYAL